MESKPSWIGRQNEGRKKEKKNNQEDNIAKGVQGEQVYQWPIISGDFRFQTQTTETNGPLVSDIWLKHWLISS